MTEFRGSLTSCLRKMDNICRQYPNTHALLVSERSDIRGDILGTFVEDICGGHTNSIGVQVIGGVNPFEFRYDNGSVVRLRSMNEGAKVLGGSYDMLFVSQGAMLSDREWNLLRSRVTGRTSTIMHPQIIAETDA